jgi:hypothetical protein
MTIARGVVAAVIFFAHLAPHLGRRAVRVAAAVVRVCQNTPGRAALERSRARLFARSRSATSRERIPAGAGRGLVHHPPQRLVRVFDARSGGRLSPPGQPTVLGEPARGPTTLTTTWPG